MKTVYGYETPAWALVAMGIGGLLLGLGAILLAGAFILNQLGVISSEAAWITAYAGIGSMGCGVPVGTLGAILAEIRKYRAAWSLANNIDVEIHAHGARPVAGSAEDRARARSRVEESIG